MFQISKVFSFEAAHRLLGHPKCGRLHGHSYRVELVLGAQELEGGMVRDYAELSAVKQFLDSTFDHKYIVSKELVVSQDPHYVVADDEELCVLMTIERSTAENMAQYLYTRFAVDYPELIAVRVSETANTWAEFRLDRGLR